MRREVPFLDLKPGPDRERIEAAIRRVLDRGQFILGPEVDAFEAEFAQLSGAPYAVAVNSGTDALSLLLRASGIVPGDEVIVPAVSSPFTAMAIVAAGARPMFVDVDWTRGTLDPACIERAITPRTRAIVPVHLYGQAADLPAIQFIAERFDLLVIEDCAQAHLATCAGQPVATTTVGGAFSFYPTKNLGALGDGGAVITRDAQIANRIRRLRHGGQAAPNVHTELGFNSRLDEIQAAILRVRLEALPAATDRRRQLAALYWDVLTSPLIDTPRAADPGHVYHLFTVRSSHRDDLQQYLAANGVGTLIHYPTPLPSQPAFRATAGTRCPQAQRLCASVLSLPLHPLLRDEDAVAVAELINRFSVPKIV